MATALPRPVPVPIDENWVPVLSTFGARLAAVQYEMHWNFSQAAKAYGQPEATYRGWVRDGREPHDKVAVVAIVHVRTGVDEDWLLRGPRVPAGCCVGPPMHGPSADGHGSPQGALGSPDGHHAMAHAH